MAHVVPTSQIVAHSPDLSLALEQPLDGAGRFFAPLTRPKKLVDFLRRFASMMAGGRNAEMLIEAATMIETLTVPGQVLCRERTICEVGACAIDKAPRAMRLPRASRRALNRLDIAQASQRQSHAGSDVALLAAIH